MGHGLREGSWVGERIGELRRMLGVEKSVLIIIATPQNGIISEQ